MGKYKVLKKIYIFIMIIIICGIFYIIYNLIFYPKVASRMDEFSLHLQDYTQVAEFYYNDFEKYNTDLLVYSVPYDNNDKDIVCFTEGYKHKIIIDEISYQSFLIICDSYYLDKQPLDYICVYDGFVSFCNNNGRASYVYSINDKKPIYIKSPNESKEDLHVRKMYDKWYFICEVS